MDEGGELYSWPSWVATRSSGVTGERARIAEAEDGGNSQSLPWQAASSSLRGRLKGGILYSCMSAFTERVRRLAAPTRETPLSNQTEAEQRLMMNMPRSPGRSVYSG